MEAFGSFLKEMQGTASGAGFESERTSRRKHSIQSSRVETAAHPSTLSALTHLIPCAAATGSQVTLPS